MNRNTTQSSTVALAVLSMAAIAFCVSIWFLYSQESPIFYIETIPERNGTYSLYLDNTCAGSVEVRSGILPSDPDRQTKIFLTTIQAEIQGRIAPLTSSIQFHQGSDGLISSFLMTIVFPGIKIESDFNASQLTFNGHFFDEPIQFSANTQPNLQFVHLKSGAAAIRGKIAENPIERIIQLTIRKQLQRVRLTDADIPCNGHVSFTELVQQLMHIQHSLSSDILALQISMPLEDRNT